MRKLVILGLLMGISAFTFAQSFKYEFIDESQGLFERFVYSLEQDQNGYILIGTTEGLFRFDGFEFKQFDVQSGLAEPFVTCSKKFSDKWILLGHNQGGISVYNGEGVDSVFVSRDHQSRIKSFAILKQAAFAFYQDGKVVRLDSLLQSEMVAVDFEGALISSAVEWNNKIAVGTDFGLALMDPANDFELVWDENLLGQSVSALTTNSETGELLVACEEEGVYLVEGLNKEHVLVQVPFEGIELMRINQMEVTNRQEVWLATKANGMIRLSNLEDSTFERAEFINKGKAKRVESVATFLVDRENIIWLGSQGEGLVKMNDNIFTQFNLGVSKQSKTVHSVLLEDNIAWVGTTTGLLKMTKDLDSTLTAFNYFDNENRPLNVNSVFKDSKGVIWVGTNSHGLLYIDENESLRSLKLADDLLNQRINCIAQQHGVIYVGTDYGLYQIKDFLVKTHLSMQSGLPHNVVNALMRDKQDRMWIGANSATLTYIEDGEIQNIPLPLQGKIVDIKSFSEDLEGRIWIGTDGAGVAMIDGNKWRLYDRDMGLFSDYCYLVQSDNKGDVWIGHRGGLSMVNPESGFIENYSNKEFGVLNFQGNAVTLDHFGELFMGTDNGILRCSASEDISESMKPVTNLTSVLISDSLYDHNEYISLRAGTYKFEFKFRGIHFRDAQDVSYRYFLEGHDIEWSESSSSNIARYTRLNPGEYTFKVRAYNKNDVGSDEVASVMFIIDHPFWKKLWFYLLVSGIVFFIVRFVIRRRERIMIQNQDFLQKELDLRTHEVVEQNKELAVINKDITDSILYAKNIQRAMLPHSSTLSDSFDESFVFLKPRDIVSGDFYWVEKFNNKILIACGDCTGHGVPGAFMSLIGIVLLKDVSRNPNIWSPSTLLNSLDRELTGMLRGENTDFSVQDGMDISIVEFDFETRILRTASARRPIIVYQDGERIELKGDRYSIGGDAFGEVKSFGLSEIQLRKGDSFYQFSDGITDQFGGPNGKKLKKSGVLQLLDSVQNQSLEAQRKTIHHKFFQWKGHNEQIDDVIMVGIKV